MTKFGGAEQNFFFCIFFRILAAVRSTPPKIGKNAKLSLSIFFDFWRRCAARRQKSEKMPSLWPKNKKSSRLWTDFFFSYMWGGGVQPQVDSMELPSLEDTLTKAVLSPTVPPQAFQVPLCAKLTYTNLNANWPI